MNFCNMNIKNNSCIGFIIKYLTPSHFVISLLILLLLNEIRLLGDKKLH